MDIRIQKTGIQFWAVWAARAAEKKQSKLPYAMFEVRFFYVVMVKQRKNLNVVASALKRYIDNR